MLAYFLVVLDGVLFARTPQHLILDLLAYLVPDDLSRRALVYLDFLALAGAEAHALLDKVPLF